MALKTQVQTMIAKAGRRRALQRVVVKAAISLSDAHLIGPQSAQTIVRLADAHSHDVIVSRRLRFGSGTKTMELSLPARYPAALRLAFEDVYRHPSEGSSLRVFGALARVAGCIGDVGAHVGLYTYVAASLAGPSARVYAFEPLPDLCRTIQRNITRNTLANVHAIAAAVGSQARQAEFCIPADTHYATLERDWLSLHRIDTFTTLAVEVVALDTFFESQAGPLPDLLKIDVEGHEQEVLDGARGILAARHPEIIIELIGADRGRGIIRQLTTQWGYRVYFIADGEAGLRELADNEPPPEGDLHNFLVSHRSLAELRRLLRLPVQQA